MDVIYIDYEKNRAKHRVLRNTTQDVSPFSSANDDALLSFWQSIFVPSVIFARVEGGGGGEGRILWREDEKEEKKKCEEEEKEEWRQE